jgi:acyl carrier protein
MKNSDALIRLLTDFFNLPSDTSRGEITQKAIAAWDSLAMVQLIADLQGTFEIEFELDEIEALRSYEEIRTVLARKGVSVEEPIARSEASGSATSEDN